MPPTVHDVLSASRTPSGGGGSGGSSYVPSGMHRTPSMASCTSTLKTPSARMRGVSPTHAGAPLTNPDGHATHATDPNDPAKKLS